MSSNDITNVNYIVRPVDLQRDFNRIVALFATVYDVPETEENLRYACNQSSYLYRLTVADNQAGQVLGFSKLEQDLGDEIGALHLQIIVDPVQRGHGIGGMLYDDALSFCVRRAVTVLRATVREGCDACMRFAERRGFAVTGFSSELALNLVGFDERPFIGAIEQVHRQGIRFTSMAELGNTSDAQRRLFELNNSTGGDVPGRTDTPWHSFEQFEESVCKQPWFQPAGQLVAIDAATGQWAGMCAIEVVEHVAYNLHTGVDRFYRGRGIAKALKLQGIRYALAQGTTQIRTNNHPENAPMLAINHWLGYRIQPGRYRLKKSL